MMSKIKSRMRGCLVVLVCLSAAGGCTKKPASDTPSAAHGADAREAVNAADNAGAVDAANHRVEQKRLGDVRLDPAIFGPEWQPSEGVVLESWDGFSALSPGVRQNLMPARSQMQSAGIIALAEYSCVRKVFPLNSVTVRVYRFENAALASAWGEKKYQYAGWEQHYTRTDGVSCFAVDSTQMKKRCVIVGEYWITTHHIGQDDLHIQALDAITQQLGLAL